MVEEAIVSLSIIISLAAFFSILARLLKQPPLIGYLAAGIFAGPLFLNFVGSDSSSSETIQLFARLGVALLLFIVGLSLDFRVFKEVGKVAMFGGVAQVALTAAAAFLILNLIGFSTMDGLYLSLALALSSTVVVVKILSDKKEIETLHGKVALGILVVQDIVAALAFMAIPFIKIGESGIGLGSIMAFPIMILAVFFLSFFVFAKLLNFLAIHQEVLFLFGISWALIVATAFNYFGFSLEIGALIAGVALASSKYTLELGSKIKPLRDFFVVMFFVYFGSQLAGPLTPEIIGISVFLSVFVLIGKPLIIMTVMRVAGYGKRTNFFTAASLAQISEFSLVLALLGFTLGHISQDIMNISILVAVITIAISSYGLYYSHSIFEKLSRLLFMFDSKNNESLPKEKKYDIILFGYHRIGFKLFEELKKISQSILVIDYNPKVVVSLANKGIACDFGDASDKDFLRELNLSDSKLIISTIPNTSANLSIQEELSRIGSEAVFLATTEQPRGALDLYSSGVDYVIVPHHLGGDFVAEMVKEFKLDKSKYKEAGRGHYKNLYDTKRKSSYR